MAILVPRLRLPSGNAARQFTRRRWVALGVGLWLGAGLAGAFGQAASREYQLKAVLLFNLTQFVEWPAAAFPTNDAPLLIGVLGVDPFGPILDDVVRDERSNGRRLVVQRCKTIAEAKHCQVLFISSSERNDLRKILGQLKGAPVLTVADFEGFVPAGGLVHFFKNPDDKIRLRINSEAAKASGLSISAKLLRVAEIAPPAPD